MGDCILGMYPNSYAVVNNGRYKNIPWQMRPQIVGDIYTNNPSKKVKRKTGKSDNFLIELGLLAALGVAEFFLLRKV